MESQAVIGYVDSMLNTELIERVLSSLPTATIGLVGDLFLDRYLEIDSTLDEPSIETGLTAYQVARVRNHPGALGTVLNNLIALGVGRIVPVTFLGDDGEGYDLRRVLATLPSVDTTRSTTTNAMRTPTYTKPMFGAREGNRFDIKNHTPTPREVEDTLSDSISRAWASFDALLVLDQVSERNCGAVTNRVREGIETLSVQTPAKFVLADSRERIGEFCNVAIKPNRNECDAAGGVAALAKRCGRTVFCTEGELGIRVHKETDEKLVPGYPVAGPVDICGAGDSCSAGILCAKVAGCSDEEAAAFGNLVASITVQQLGTTGTASPQQVRERWAVVNR